VETIYLSEKEGQSGTRHIMHVHCTHPKPSLPANKIR